MSNTQTNTLAPHAFLLYTDASSSSSSLLCVVVFAFFFLFFCFFFFILLQLQLVFFQEILQDVSASAGTHFLIPIRFARCGASFIFISIFCSSSTYRRVYLLGAPSSLTAPSATASLSLPLSLMHAAGR